MFRKKSFIFGKIFYTTLVFVVLASFAIVSCEKEKAPPEDPNTLPMANFFYKIQYKTLGANTYAYVTTTNNSAYSNRWKWSRPGSIEKVDSPLDTLIRPVVFETKKQDTIIEQVYMRTNENQRFKITLIAYSDVPIGMNPDSTIIYKTFESHPFVQEIVVEKPK
jgi:hypothetical protein